MAMTFSFSPEIIASSKQLQQQAYQYNMCIITAESCTGGLLMAALTEIAGASTTIWHGYITYHNQSKQDLLGVSATTLTQEGAVSATCATEMALGALKQANHSINANITTKKKRKNILTIAITGIAGDNQEPILIPDATAKPTGLVYIATAKQYENQISHQAQQYNFTGNRNSVRIQAVLAALQQASAFT